MHTDSRTEGMKQGLIGLNELEEDFQERADTYQVERFSMGQQQQNWTIELCMCKNIASIGRTKQFVISNVISVFNRERAILIGVNYWL